MLRIPVPNPDHPVAQFIRDHLGFIDLEKGPWVAGSAARMIYEGIENFEYSDIDIFFPPEPKADDPDDHEDPKILRALIKPKELKEGEAWPPADIPPDYASPMLSKCEKQPFGATSTIFYPNITAQFVTFKRYATVEDLLDYFDFTVCMMATDGREIIMHEQTPADISSRTLRTVKIPHTPRPFRLAKYVAMGFDPAPGVFEQFFVVPNMGLKHNQTMADPNGKNITIESQDEY